MEALTSEPDWSTVLAALNEVLADQQQMLDSLLRGGSTLSRIESRLASINDKPDDTNARVRSLQDITSEIKELLIRGLERPSLGGAAHPWG